jgi:hypothetical protein
MNNLVQYATIHIGTTSCQGVITKIHDDGKVSINIGSQIVTGWPVLRQSAG